MKNEHQKVQKASPISIETGFRLLGLDRKEVLEKKYEGAEMFARRFKIVSRYAPSESTYACNTSAIPRF